jgi:hypothetical protein
VAAEVALDVALATGDELDAQRIAPSSAAPAIERCPPPRCCISNELAGKIRSVADIFRR